MARIWLFLAALFAFIFGLAAYMPLSAAMQRTSLNENGLGWLQARGTVWDGQVTGISWRGQAIGGADLKMKPLGLLAGRVSYDLIWRGPAGQARGQLSLSRGQYQAKNIRADIAQSAIAPLRKELGDLGARIHLTDGVMDIRQDKCLAASGLIRTDILRLFGARLGRDWPQLTGQIVCEEGRIVIPLQGQAGTGERFDIRTEIDPSGTAMVIIMVNGADPQLQNVLALYGFAFNNGAYRLNRRVQLNRSTQ